MRNFILIFRFFLILFFLTIVGCRGVIKSASKVIEKQLDSINSINDELTFKIDTLNTQEEKSSNKSKQEKISAVEKSSRELEQCKSLQQFQIKKYGRAMADCEDRTKEEAYRIYTQQNHD